ncbi:hypothetical protein [uncultured Campylobacter sp.]|uniref:hypothetical protein n=1 Tax=uncultured Campylobacter sp. TaxID=218934 RepID=UPI002608CA0A|nr:hypothetical protein [uncultured Campylobacter sp.]
MDSKSGLGSAGDREARLKFSLLAALAWVFHSFWWILSSARRCASYVIFACSKSCDRIV